MLISLARPVARGLSRPTVASRVASRTFLGGLFGSKPVGSSDGWSFALTEVDADKAAEAKLPVPESEFFLPVPSKMTAIAERGFTEYAFVTWASMGEGAALAPAGSFCFKGPDVAPIWKAMALTEPHPVRAATVNQQHAVPSCQSHERPCTSLGRRRWASR